MASSDNRNRGEEFEPVPPGLFVAAGFLVLLALYIVIDPLAWSNMVTFAHAAFPVLVPLGVLILMIACIAWAASRVPDKPWSYSSEVKASYEKERRAAVARVVRYSLGGVAVLAVVIWYWVVVGYHVDKTYLDQVKVVTTTAPSFEQRAAHPVAQASSRTNLGETVGDLTPVRLVVDGEKQTWNALVLTRSTFGGYQAIQEQTIGLTGTTQSVRMCTFKSDTADRRIGGWFSHSLDRAIASKERGLTFDGDDAYGVCSGENGEHPLVIVPLKKVVGWVTPHEIPAGVAVYDGLTGEVTIHKTVTAGQLPGPVYPMSLAARNREALAATGTFGDYRFSRAGFESTARDTDDPNAANASEFSLRRVGGGGAYVTPLTPRGGSVSIVAEAVVDSQSVTAGQLNELVVHKLSKPRPANSTTLQKIRGDYGDLPEWAAKMHVYEIVPVSTDTWVASLGQDQDVNYRVSLKADGTSCLERSDGTKLRCGKVTGTGENGPGVALQDGIDKKTGTAPVAKPIPANADLGKLSDADLVTLHEQVTKEMLTRMSK